MNETHPQDKSSDNGSIPAQKKDSIASRIFKGFATVIGGVILAGGCFIAAIVGGFGNAYGEHTLANNLMSAGPLFLLVILVILTVVVIVRSLKRSRKE